MKKRSELKKRSSAADRTLPMFKEDETPPKTKVDVKNIVVSCDACETETRVEKLTQRADGEFECPECGAPVEVGKETKKILKEQSTGFSKPVEKSQMKEPKVDKQTAPASAITGVFCSECGAQWAMLNGKKYPVCGHKTEGVDDPSFAKRINPPAGLQWPTVKKVRVVFGEQMFRVADYSTFRTPVVELEAEVKPNEDFRKVQEILLQEAQRFVSDKFIEIHKAYMEKLEFIHKDFQSRD